LLDSSQSLYDFYTTYTDSAIAALNEVDDSISGLYFYSAYLSNSYHVIDSTLNVLSDSIAVLDSLMNSDTLNAPTYISIKETLRLQAITLQNSLAVLDAQIESLRENRAISASDLNGEISPNQLPESNEQIINEIYLSTIAVGTYALNGSQASTVLSVAQQCPYAGGKAVYRARTLYLLVDPLIEYDDDSICLLYGIYRNDDPSPSMVTETGNIILIPNPANDFVTVIYRTVAKGSCSLYITDVTGKLVEKVDLPCDKTHYDFSVSGIYNGLYLVNVLNNDESIGRSKMAIMR
jgi:hypothetical protein